MVTAGLTETGTVTAIDVFSSKIGTAEGIHPGSTVEELTAAYPLFDAVVHSYFSDIYVLDGTVGRLLIEVATDGSTTSGYWAGGEVGHVIWIRAVPLAQKPYSIVATDTSGPCIV